MTDNIYKNTPQNMEKAADIIKNGGLVAFPTETVYGLGANVYNAQAVAAIFAAKQRPHFDPLISHIAEVDFLKEYAATDARVFALAKRFWPGPLTFVLKRVEKRCTDCGAFGQQIPVSQPDHGAARCRRFGR